MWGQGNARVHGVYSGCYSYPVLRINLVSSPFLSLSLSSITGSWPIHRQIVSILRAGMEDNLNFLIILFPSLPKNPNSFLLTFAYAEAQELEKDVYATFDKLLTTPQVKLERLAAALTPPTAAQ